jgi:hypothetical protein
MSNTFGFRNTIYLLHNDHFVQCTDLFFTSISRIKVQGGSNMTGTNCDLNHIIFSFLQNGGICVWERRAFILFLWQVLQDSRFRIILRCQNTRVITITDVIFPIFFLRLLDFILRMLRIMSTRSTALWKILQGNIPPHLSAVDRKHRQGMHQLWGTGNVAVVTLYCSHCACHKCYNTVASFAAMKTTERNVILAEQFPFPVLVNMIFHFKASRV